MFELYFLEKHHLHFTAQRNVFNKQPHLFPKNSTMILKKVDFYTMPKFLFHVKNKINANVLNQKFQAIYLHSSKKRCQQEYLT